MVKSPDIPLNLAGSHFQKLYYLFFPFYNSLSKVRPDSSSCSSRLLGCQNLDYLLNMQSRNWSNQIISSHLILSTITKAFDFYLLLFNLYINFNSESSFCTNLKPPKITFYLEQHVCVFPTFPCIYLTFPSMGDK